MFSFILSYGPLAFALMRPRSSTAKCFFVLGPPPQNVFASEVLLRKMIRVLLAKIKENYFKPGGVDN